MSFPLSTLKAGDTVRAAVHTNASGRNEHVTVDAVVVQALQIGRFGDTMLLDLKLPHGLTERRTVAAANITVPTRRRNAGVAASRYDDEPTPSARSRSLQPPAITGDAEPPALAAPSDDEDGYQEFNADAHEAANNDVDTARARPRERGASVSAAQLKAQRREEAVFIQFQAQREVFRFDKSAKERLASEHGASLAQIEKAITAAAKRFRVEATAVGYMMAPGLVASWGDAELPVGRTRKGQR